MTNDPWADIESPLVTAAITARRIDAECPWAFFWARDLDQKRLLVLRFNVSSTPRGRLPKLKGLDVTILESGQTDERMLILKLLDQTQSDVFFRLCSDIMSSAADAINEADAVDRTVSRTWRWHHLLRGGSNGRLQSEEQKGLIGELRVLEQHILPNLTAHDAVKSWLGPTGSPKDFEVGRICIEAKARRGAAAPYVLISSAAQLDSSGADMLFLNIIELDIAPSGCDKSFSVTDIAKRIRAYIVERHEGAEIEFDSLLLAAGFRWTDDYSDSLWIEGQNRLYRVFDDFPRIVATSVPTGVSDVKYSIALGACEPFEVPNSSVDAEIGLRNGQ